MISVGCPHSNPPAARDCSGCDSREDGVRWCEGEATAVIRHDSDGDAGVIGGIRVLTVVEDLELSCGCTLSEQEADQVCDELADKAAGYEYDASDDPRFPY